MANPQKENGHTPISNELLEAIYRYNFTGTEMAIMLCTIRKTYGYHKKTDRISIGQYQQETGMARRTVIDCLNRLVSYNALVKSKSSFITEYGIQKDYDRWVVSQRALVRDDAKTSAGSPPKLVSCTAPTKDIKKQKKEKLKKLKELKEDLLAKKII